MRWPFVLAAALLWCLSGAWILWAVYQDGVATVEPPAIGLWQHYGFLASFVASPLLCGLVWLSGRQFVHLLEGLVERESAETGEVAIRPLAVTHLRSLRLGGHSRWALIALIVFAGVAEILIFSRLRSHTYNSVDVFNAPAHSMSYLAANSHLVVLWTVIYPLTLFYVSHIVISACMIVESLAKEQLLRLDCLHRDGCGGVAPLRALSITQLIVQVALTLTVGFFLITFSRSYLTLLAISFLLLLFALANFFAFWWIASAFKKERDRQLLEWNEVIRRSIRERGLGSTKTLVAMEYRDSVLKTRLLSWQNHVAPLLGAGAFMLTVARFFPLSEEPPAAPPPAPTDRRAPQAVSKTGPITLDYRWFGWFRTYCRPAELWERCCFWLSTGRTATLVLL